MFLLRWLFSDQAKTERDLLAWIDAEEKEDKDRKWGVAPAPYERLAILYRKRKEYDKEIKILKRYFRQKQANGRKPAILKKRLKKALQYQSKV